MATSASMIGIAILASQLLQAEPACCRDVSSRTTPLEVILGPVTNPSNGHTYYLLANGRWSEAESTAQVLGGHLATVDDAAENAWVLSTFYLPHPGPFALWIGFNDATNEGVFEWVGGAPTAYTNWDANEPNNFNGVEDFAQMGSLGKWNDVSDVGLGGWMNFGVVESSPPPPPVCNGDADADLDRDFGDITVVLANFGMTYGSSGVGDANHNGVVNFADITEVLALFGVPCP